MKNNNLATVNPKLAKEWHSIKNGSLTPCEVMPNSDKIVWWQCMKGHEWQSTIGNRNRGSGCPYCSNQKALPGYNDLETTNPDLAREWHPIKNDPLMPSNVMAGSRKKVWWQCVKGHEWQAAVYSKKTGGGCPICANKQVLPGYNDLATTNPVLAKEWHPIRNRLLTPMAITFSSGKKVWWQCSKGHEWQATLNHRNTGGGCPICANKQVLPGYNDLATINPTLAKEWHPTFNGSLTPSNVTASSHKKVWWQCAKGHEWQVKVTDRNRERGCPICAGKRVLVGYNDLNTTNSELAKEWHPTRNSSLLPSAVTSGSNKKVWWQCAKGHEWQSTINNRDKGNGCPICNAETHTSFPEQAIYFYLNQRLPAENRVPVCGMEVDVYLPMWKIGIEYDGMQFHNSAESSKRENKKDEKLAQNGITIIRVKESESNEVDHGRNIIYCVYNSNYSYLEHVLKHLATMLFQLTGKQFLFDVDINRDRTMIMDQYITSEKNNSLAIRNPELANSWNYNRNGLLTPEKITFSSHKTVWWICGKSHEWQATIHNRNRGDGCPYCGNKKVLPGYNDLETVNPKLAKEWHTIKNGSLIPSNVAPNSNRRAWWQCIHGHEWKAFISDRNRGSGCLYCLNQKVLPGYNDLETTNPDLAREWHPIKNDPLLPSNVMAGSDKKVWWQCAKGHEWQAAVYNRNTGGGCPICANKQVLPGYNDLATTNPVLAKEWHPTKNGLLTPTDLTINSGKKVWWQCTKGHEWQATLNYRNTRKGCPTCRKQVSHILLIK